MSDNGTPAPENDQPDNRLGVLETIQKALSSIDLPDPDEDSELNREIEEMWEFFERVYGVNRAKCTASFVINAMRRIK